MANVVPKILKRIRKWKTGARKSSSEAVARLFRFRYGCFKDLLASNTELLHIITDLEEKLRGQEVFGMSYVRSQASRAVFHAYRMVKSLDDLSGHRYPRLFAALEDIHSRIDEELGKRKEVPISELTLPYSRVTRELVDWVGGKNANLGELLNQVQIPVPSGFAITTLAYEFFIDFNDLIDEIDRLKMELEPGDPSTVASVSTAIQELIKSAEVPPAVRQAINDSYEAMATEIAERIGKPGFRPNVSLRSSAIGEDSELTYAGQYLSVLNVPPEKIIESYKAVLASLYTPRAISYRLSKGMRSEDIAMSVGCVEMVESEAAGVLYSRDPCSVLNDTILLNAVWGLGPYAVDGVITPDSYTVTKSEQLSILGMCIAHKPVKLTSAPGGGLKEVPVDASKQGTACLTTEQIKTLASYGLKVEKHYQYPQDIEWALDPGGNLLILQARPLHLRLGDDSCLEATPRLDGYPLLVEGGAIAVPGIGSGPAFHVRSDKDLLEFPDGGVLVAKHSSAQFVIAMPKAQAIVTGAGSVTGHMASLAREFGVPTIVDAKVGVQNIPDGCQVTVDALSGRVYEGTVPELMALKKPQESVMKGTPVYQTLRRIAESIVPLNLVDPRSPCFAAEYCKTLHDVMRFVHELSYHEMFLTSDLVSDTAGGGAYKLAAPIPLDLYLIDLGDGISQKAWNSKRVTVDEIVSVPFRAILNGMLHEDLRTIGPRPVDLRGFFSVMREQMLTPNQMAERFGARSYAIISDTYVNFSSRIGYHYSVLDSYCGKTINKNYITFSFKGGAADDVRRYRRARAIARILEALDFAVDVQEDRVDARFYKHEQPVIEAKLDMVGRMLQFTRQMDMLMYSEASVKAIADNFLAGNYQLDEEFWASLEPKGEGEG